MLEVLVWSLLIGSLGLEGVIAGSWLNWQQLRVRQHYEEEEEFLTHYNSDKEIWEPESHTANGTSRTNTNASLDPRLVGWEYKIVRASSDLFRDPKILQRLRDEEADSGWILLEKLDDRRIRFKRPLATAQIQNTEYLEIDPYRSHYGSSAPSLSWLVALGAFIALALPAYFGYTLVSTTLDRSNESPNPPTPSAPIAPPLAPSTPQPLPNSYPNPYPNPEPPK
jgi:hypothetical protein